MVVGLRRMVVTSTCDLLLCTKLTTQLASCQPQLNLLRANHYIDAAKSVGLVMNLFSLGTLLAFALTQALVSATLSVESAILTDQNGGFLEKTWTVRGEDNDVINDLQVAVAGNVFVDYDASLRNDSGVSAKVTMKSSSSSMINLVDVSVIARGADNGSGFRVHYKNENARVVGEVVTQITLSDPNVVSALGASVADNVVVGSGVLVTNDESASLKFTASGDSDIFLGSVQEMFSLNDLEIASSGDGRVQFLASSIQANDIVLDISGDGKAAVIATEKITADSITSAISGDGKVFVEAADLQSKALTATLTGDGKLAYSTAGSCVNQEINLKGNGAVYAGPIVCKDTYVSTSGDSKAMVQTTGTLTTVGHGKVKYVGVPQHIVSRPAFRKHSNIKEARFKKVKVYTVRTPPSKIPTNLRIILRASWFGDSPTVSVHWGWGYGKPTIVETTGPEEETMGLAATNIYSIHSTGTGTIGVFAVVALIAFVAFKYHARHTRQEYAPLP